MKTINAIISMFAVLTAIGACRPIEEDAHEWRVATEGSSSSSSGGESYCGNGVVEAGEECDDGNGEDWDECSTSCVRWTRKVFLSSVVVPGRLRGIAMADALCQGLAEQAELPGEFGALVADSPATSAFSRLLISDWVYLRVDGSIAFDGHPITYVPTNPIHMDEWGMVHEGELYAWTNATGYYQDCNDWYSNNQNDLGRVGQVQSTTSTWLDAGTSSCQAEHHVYCFERD